VFESPSIQLSGLAFCKQKWGNHFVSIMCMLCVKKFEGRLVRHREIQEKSSRDLTKLVYLASLKYLGRTVSTNNLESTIQKAHPFGIQRMEL